MGDTGFGPVASRTRVILGEKQQLKDAPCGAVEGPARPAPIRRGRMPKTGPLEASAFRSSPAFLCGWYPIA